jgi:DNA-binding transcriptional LysR family regulator
MWSAVELREIRVFLTLCDELHFGRTADRLHLTSSRVSQIIRDLETKLGVPLFVRTSRRVALTEHGVRLRAELQPGLDLIREALVRIQRETGTGRLKVGELFGAGGPRFVEIISAYEATHRAGTVEVSETPWKDPLGPLLRREVDLLAIRLPIDEPNLVNGPILTSEPRVVAVARSHPLAARASVGVEDLADFRVGRFAFLPKEMIADLIPLSTPTGRPIPRTAEPLHSLGEVATAVALGRIVQPTVPRFGARFDHPEIVLVPLRDLPPSRTGLVWRRDNHDPRITAFAELAARIVEQPGAPPAGPEVA